MSTIRIKPKGADGPVLEGELTGSPTNPSWWFVSFAPGLPGNVFPKKYWEEVPPPFTFPTKPGAVIARLSVVHGSTTWLYYTLNSYGLWVGPSGTSPRDASVLARAPFKNAKWRVVFEGEDL